MLVSQQYPELLHYTTLDGLRGILSSGCLWATDAACLNDSSEITYFFDKRVRDLILVDARKYATELAENPKYLAQMIMDGGIDNVVHKEADVWQDSLRRVTLEVNRPFVFSLSGPSDSLIQTNGLLSQWRGYGGDGGYALVFDTEKLEAMLTCEASTHHYMHVQMGDVYYHGIDPQKQPATPDVVEYEEIVHLGASRMIRGGKAEETERFYEAITALSCLYKHWGFWEEREVRIVVVPASEKVAKVGERSAPPRKNIQSFVRDGRTIPYVELFSASDSATARVKLPVKRVIIGPHKNRELHAESVRELLGSGGYAVNVVQSQIPYIGR